MYTVTSGIHIHFGHHVRGHDGPCISLHGHTWKFEVTLGATELDHQGFVMDFDILYAKVLTKAHALLDHGFAVGANTWEETAEQLAILGEKLVATRHETIGSLGEPQPMLEGELNGARNERPGGIKIAVFPFTPTSERLAHWLYDVSVSAVADDRVKVTAARVYETLHPTVLVAEYRP